MSAFEIKLTPTRCKSKRNTESREPTEVVMAPFSGKSIVVFEGVPVTKTARRILRIINPSEEDIEVSVCKAIKPEHNLNLEWMENSVPAQNEIAMELVWSPQIDISCKETLQLIDNRNFRKDVMIILKSQPHKTVKSIRKYPTISSTNMTLRLKSPTNAANKASRISGHHHHHHHQQHQQQHSQKKRLSTLELSNKKSQASIIMESKPQPPASLSSYSNAPRNQHSSASTKLASVKSSIHDNAAMLKANIQHVHSNTSPLMERNFYANEKDNVATKLSPHVLNEHGGGGGVGNIKENVSPMALANVFDIIDEMNFTPATVTLSKPPQSRIEQLASLPTPMSTAVPVTLTPEQLNESRGELKPRCLSVELEEDIDLQEVNSNEDLHNATKVGTSLIVTNKTFDVKHCESLESSIENLNSSSDDRTGNIWLPLNKTTVICTTPVSRHLEMIMEEDNYSQTSNTASTDLLKTPKSTVDEDLIRDIKLVGSPLRKYSESMKDLYQKSPQRTVLTQGSLPNLNEMETIKSIEQNRYFNQSSTSRKDVNDPKLSSQNNGKTSTERQGNKETYNISQPDILFNQNEILAQSSRFNVNEVGLKYRKNSPVANKNKGGATNKNIPTTPKMATKVKLNSMPEKVAIKRGSHELSFSDSQSVDSIVSYCSSRTNSTKSSSTAASPPKRQRLDNRSPSSLAAVQNVKTWSQTQPKKFKLAKTLSLVKKPLTPRKLKEEPRTRLYDCELFLQPYINPDPFAATTTCDPFLASTMYLDEEAVDRHQVDFKKWLNALVTIPADLNTDSNTKIDVGKLFNEVRQKDLILAPTKEEQSMNYLTNFRLESLRKAAVQLFLSEEMRGPCSKVAVYVQKNALRIRSDRNLHLDVVTQREILELLLCINPLWLRLGLEVVYGEKIHLQSNSDIVGLSSFILNRFFRDKFLEQKYCKAYTLSDEYAEHIKKFTLQKFFFLMLFLDKAKEKRIVTHNPCLFIKKSPHKETRDILLRFSSELLANVGDITRNLKRLGYVLIHKQNYIDEFDYAFHNLAVDLRDGIRLTRVMEIILLRDDLTKQLRVPAISRLQRIFNVNLGLKALSEADFQLGGDIQAYDIVDGHREKTLSLLWQIIYKFRSPKFHAAAKVIQNWWRISWLKVFILRRIRHKQEMRREAAATVIQKGYRALMARRFAIHYREERTMAAIVLQKYFRGYLARKKFNHSIHCIFVIQKWFKAKRLVRQDRERFKKIRESTICLQRHWRLRRDAKELKKLAALEKCKYHQQRNRAATLMQSLWRRYKARKAFCRILSAILLIQRKLRANKLMKQQKLYYQRLEEAVICIQRKFRANRAMNEARANYRKYRTTVLYVQRKYRATVLMRMQREEYLNIRQKVVFIQQKWRATLLSRLVRVEFLAMQYYTTVMQQRFRANKQMQIERNKYQKLRNCVINVQRLFRAKLEMRRVYQEFQAKLNAIQVIQVRFRAHKAMRYQRAKYQGTRAAVLCIQEHFKNHLKMKEERTKYETLKKAVVSIQRAYRLRLIMKQTKEKYEQMRKAAICIQTRFRALLQMREIRQEYLRHRSIIIKIQLSYKATLLARKVRKEYLHKRYLVVKVQRRFRAKQFMRLEQQKYQQIRAKVICLQTHVRSFLQMRQEQNLYQKQKAAAIKIQYWYRSILKLRSEKDQFQRIRSSSITIQRRWKATLLAREVRSVFVQTIQKIVKLQRFVRATLQMRPVRDSYQKQRQAAITIQRRFRAHREMLQIRSQYQLIRSLIVCIQRQYRANKEMIRVRHDFVLLRKVTIHLQQKYRGRIKMREERERFVQLKTNIVQFQVHARGFLARRRFQAIMTPEMKELLRQKKAVKIIQRFWRGYRIRKRLCNARLKKIRKNIAMLKESTTAKNSIRFKVQDAVRILRGRFSASDALNVLVRLDRLSRTVPHLLMNRTDFISTFCYGIMAQAIRSEVDKQLIMYCCRIILNLARYNSTTVNTFQEGGLVTIAQILLRWCDKDCEIFNTLCTLIWIFAHCPVKCKIIRDFMTTTDAIYMVRETKKLVARKEKMKQNVRKPIVTQQRGGGGGGSSSTQPNFSSRALPSLEPDYGVIRNKPYTFISSVYAFDTILYKLGIDIF